MKKLAILLFATLTTAATAFAENSAAFVGVDVGTSHISMNTSGTINGGNHYSYESPGERNMFYGLRIGYAHFLAPQLGFRGYVFGQKRSETDQSTKENEAVKFRMNLERYGVGADALFNLFEAGRAGVARSSVRPTTERRVVASRTAQRPAASSAGGSATRFGHGALYGLGVFAGAKLGIARYKITTVGNVTLASGDTLNAIDLIAHAGIRAMFLGAHSLEVSFDTSLFTPDLKDKSTKAEGTYNTTYKPKLGSSIQLSYVFSF